MKSYKLQTHEKIFETGIILENIVINKENRDKLEKTKQKIDEHAGKWDINKKISNIYEYVYTSSNSKKNICDKSPISRSYFKLCEIITDFDLKKDNISICCIAEGPGGFVEYLLENIKNISNLFANTLLSEDNSIPKWNFIIKKNKLIQFLNGVDNTGDIYNLENIDNFILTVGKNSCDLITSDGGIDYSNNYNNQEIDSYKLIYSEIFIVLNLQKKGGSFVIKIFDIFYYNTIQLLYILYLCYEEVIITKPYTSRPSNSEKYIVCKNFNIDNNLEELLNYMRNHNWSDTNLSLKIPNSFLLDIKIFNDQFVLNQINTINEVINQINKNLKIYNPSEDQIKKSIEWCKNYNLPINKYYISM